MSTCEIIFVFLITQLIIEIRVFEQTWYIYIYIRVSRALFKRGPIPLQRSQPFRTPTIRHEPLDVVDRVKLSMCARSKQFVAVTRVYDTP